MQQSLSSDNFIKPSNMTYNNTYKPNYQQYPILPKQEYQQQLYPNYPHHSKQYLTKNYQQYPTHSNYYTKNYKSTHQPINMNQCTQVTSPQTISKHIHNQLSQEKPSSQNLKIKIKQIKTALKIAQEHNQQLHTKLNNQKKANRQQIASYEKDLYRYKSLYEMLVENLDKKADELNETKRELQQRRVEVNELRRVIEGDGALKISNKMNSPEHFNSQHINLKQLPTRQQVSIEHLIDENRLLRQQLLLKTKKLSEYDIIISTYQTQQKLHKSHRKTVSQLQLRISELQRDSEKVVQQRGSYRRRVQEVQMELQETRSKLMSVQNEVLRTINDNEQLKLTNSQLESELQSMQQLVKDYESGQEKGRWKGMFDQLSEKYNELLRSNYQTQKEFEKQLHLITSEVQRRQILKYSHR